MIQKEFLEQLLQIPIIYRTKISPKKNKIGFSWKNIHENVDVFCLDLENNSKPYALTKTPESTMLKNFYPKSDAVIVGEDKSRNERVRLFRANLNEPMKMIPLTEDNPNYFMRGGEISPDEKWLFFDANYDVEKKQLWPR